MGMGLCEMIRNDKKFSKVSALLSQDSYTKITRVLTFEKVYLEATTGMTSNGFRGSS
jgi:hypothetical protein